jgi:hypothetical protein
MAKKEFNKKFAHPTRRKLMDMVMSGGEYESDVKVGYRKSETSQSRNVGDVWEDDDGKMWEQKEGFKVRKSKLTDIMSEIRNDLYKQTRCSHKECDKKGKYSRTDKRIIEKYTYCTSCLAKLEHPIRVDGNWETYKTFRASSDMLKEGSEIIENLNRAYEEAKQEYEYVNADGTTQKWKMEKPVEEIKSEILKEIEIVSEQLETMQKVYDESFDMLKGFDYELLKV